MRVYQFVALKSYLINIDVVRHPICGKEKKSLNLDLHRLCEFD